jgi:hypothetical protein
MWKAIYIRTSIYTVILTAIIAVPVILSGQTAHLKPGQKSVKPSDPILEEAKSMANKYWTSTMTHCGESYYSVALLAGAGEGGWTGVTRHTLYEHRNLSFVVEPQELTQADQLNGTEWHGLAYLTYSAYRSSALAGDVGGAVWGPWSDYDRDPFGRSAHMPGLWLKRQHGEWTISISALDGNGGGPINVSLRDAISASVDSEWQPATCSSIPGTAEFRQAAIKKAEAAANADVLNREQQAVSREKMGVRQQAIIQAKAELSDFLSWISNINGGPIPNLDVIDLQELYRSFGKRPIPHDAVYVHPVDKQIGAFPYPYGIIYIQVRQPVSSYDPEPAPRTGNPPYGSWWRSAIFNYHSGVVTGTIPAGTICQFGLGIWRHYTEQFGAGAGGVYPSVNPFIGAKCYGKDDFLDNPTFRTFSLDDKGLDYFTNATTWVKAHDAPMK